MKMVQLFRTIENENSKQIFSLNVQIQDDYFILIILQDHNAWQADISLVDVGTFAEEVGLSNEEYFSKLKKYLLETPNNIEFRFTKGEFFCYVKAQKGINLKYFSIRPPKIEINFNQLLELYSLECQKLREENESIIKERNKLKEVNVNLENKLKELVARKLKDEEELYSNFVLVVNEKKRRIQHLNQLLQAFKASRPVLNPQVNLKRKPKKNIVKNQIKDEVSESDSESETGDYNTDEEKSVKEDKNIEELLLPSTSKKQNFSSLFDDEDENEIHSLPKRVKTNNLKTKDCFENMPSTSKIQEKKTDEVNEDIEKASSQVGFSTQDLLDCID